MAKQKTIRRSRFTQKAVARTQASWAGAEKILALLARAKGSDIATGYIGVDHLQKISGGQF